MHALQWPTTAQMGAATTSVSMTHQRQHGAGVHVLAAQRQAAQARQPLRHQGCKGHLFLRLGRILNYQDQARNVGPLGCGGQQGLQRRSIAPPRGGTLGVAGQGEPLLLVAH